jgi:hypothetical protein
VYDALPFPMLTPMRTRSLLQFRLHLLAGIYAAMLPSLSVATTSELPRLEGEIKIDGVLENGEWQGAVRIDLGVETSPAENQPAPVRTTAFLIEDGENLYVAFDAKDPDPQAIRAYLRDRDSAWEDDYVGISLDTYNDERRAFQFFANPLGVQMDKIHSDVSSGGNGRGDDAAWDAIWESAGHINDTGYVVEMRIPLSQLRFPAASGRKTWGYDLMRQYPRDRKRSLASNPQDRNRSCYLCQVGKLEGLDGSQPGHDIEVVPTLTASRIETTDDPAFIPLSSGDMKVEGGLTMRWGITPDLTSNLAINPDFSQIESDVLQLDVNNRFALFFPEKRPFFLEGADYFKTPLDAVFTRTVSDPEVGLKLTGKRRDHTFGFFLAEDAETNLLFPGAFDSDSETLDVSNTALVGRYNYGFANTSSLGILVTARDGEGYNNIVGGLDGRWKISDQHSIEFQYLSSDTEYPLATAIEFEQPLTSFSGDAAKVRYEFRSRDWFANTEYNDRSSGFRADSGFISKVGGRALGGVVGRIWHGGEENWWNRVRASVHVDHEVDENERLLNHQNVLRLGFGGQLQTWFQFALVDSRELWEGVTYDLTSLRAYAEIRPVGAVSLRVLGVIGDNVDYSNDRLGKTFRLEPSIDWNISRKLLLRLKGVYAELETQDGEQIFNALVADTRLTWQFNLRSFLRLTAQTTDVERNQALYIEEVDSRSRDIGRQLLYSYKLNPQTVFFLGYSDQYVDEDNLDGLTVSDRTWFMKIGYAWTP